MNGINIRFLCQICKLTIVKIAFLPGFAGLFKNVIKKIPQAWDMAIMQFHTPQDLYNLKLSSKKLRRIERG